MNPGDLVVFQDGNKSHMALLLSVRGERTWALFFTSKPEWNPAARKLLDNELQDAWHRTEKESWIAPVVRPFNQISSTQRSISKSELDKLIEEFGPDPTFLPRSEVLPSTKRVRPTLPTKSIADIMSEVLKKRNPDLGGVPFKEYMSDKVNFIQTALFAIGFRGLSFQNTKLFVHMFPELENQYFVRRHSVLYTMQCHWLEGGLALKRSRLNKGAEIRDVAAVLGLPDQDILDFESGIQAPSWTELLSLRHAYGDVHPRAAAAIQVPSWNDYMYFMDKRRNLNLIQTRTRINRKRIDDIMFFCKKPTPDEERRLRVLFPGLPYWRPMISILEDSLQGMEEKHHVEAMSHSYSHALQSMSKIVGIEVPEGIYGHKLRGLLEEDEQMFKDFEGL